LNRFLVDFLGTTEVNDDGVDDWKIQRKCSTQSNERGGCILFSTIKRNRIKHLNNGTKKPDWYNGSTTKQPRRYGSENVEDKEQAASSCRVCSVIRIIAFNAVQCKDEVRPHPRKTGWPAASSVSQG
jgi:hypothetical protein